MNEIMTIQEVNERYPDEWVVIEDFEFDDHHALVRGKVVAHSKCHKEIYELMPDLKDRSFFLLSTSEMPEDMEHVL
ncbi:MAG: hypothetical protein O3B01_29675 [Planctomycetota bacterium]|nr:hypothetical protein [Planctomycetota bacterium]MDA1142753.1 hypothetical protein [Planctomycetota bacterium]